MRTKTSKLSVQCRGRVFSSGGCHVWGTYCSKHNPSHLSLTSMYFRVLPIFFLIFAAEAAFACSKAVAGATINWAGVVCEWRAETDDLFDSKVQSCFKELIARDRVPSAPAENCPLNVKYKTEICKGIAHGNPTMSRRSCMRSVETVPREVSHGVGS